MSGWVERKKIASCALGLMVFLLAGPLSAWQLQMRQPAMSADRISRQVELQPLQTASKPWRLCAIYPHLKDSYWLSVNYGMVDQVRKLGVVLKVFEARGYPDVERQKTQLQQCISWQADAIILGAVSYGGLKQDIVEISKKLPVFGVINGIDPQGISGWVGVDWFDMGFYAGQFVAQQAKLKKSPVPVKVGWFTGLLFSKNGRDLVGDGVAAGLKQADLSLEFLVREDYGKDVQRNLIQQQLAIHPYMDYLIAGAVPAEVTVNELRRQKRDKETGIVSHYFSHGVYRGLRRNKILMASNDQMALQGRLSVDQAVRSLEGKPFYKDIGPKILVLTPNNLKSFQLENSLSPAGFRPVYSVNDQATSEPVNK